MWKRENWLIIISRSPTYFALSLYLLSNIYPNILYYINLFVIPYRKSQIKSNVRNEMTNKYLKGKKYFCDKAFPQNFYIKNPKIKFSFKSKVILYKIYSFLLSTGWSSAPQLNPPGRCSGGTRTNGGGSNKRLRIWGVWSTRKPPGWLGKTSSRKK